MEQIKAPNKFNYLEERISIFLAGSIEMGAASDWQAKVADRLSKYDVVLLNPRRDDWDTSWEQTTENEHFVEQVEWEMDCLNGCSYIFMNLEPNTISPISLLELGAYSNDGKMMVCCPKEFFRSGNVEIFCDYHLIRFYNNLDDAIDNLEQMVIRVINERGLKNE